MKFKTKEELKIKSTSKNAEYYNEGVNDAFKSFKERIEFYEKYKDAPKVFYVDYPEIAKSVPWLFNTHNYDSDVEMWYAFNEWLFDYCFCDIK